MDDRIKAKRVGQVNICEVFGNFSDGFARRGKVALGQLAQPQLHAPDLFLNVSELDEIDNYGLEVVRESAGLFAKKALWVGDAKVTDRFKSEGLRNAYKFVKSRAEAAGFFATELAVRPKDSSEGDERRGFVRLKTIVPAHFYLPMGGSTQVDNYFAVVTNLSEGGFYAEFIDSGTETMAIRELDPIELKLIDVRLALTPALKVSGQAKVVHAKRGEGGIGMEFYRLAEQDRSRLNEWLAEQFAAQTVDPKDSSGGGYPESQGGKNHEKV